MMDWAMAPSLLEGLCSIMRTLVGILPVWGMKVVAVSADVGGGGGGGGDSAV